MPDNAETTLDDIITRYVQECIGLLDDEIKKTYFEALEENQRLRNEINELRQREINRLEAGNQILQQRLLADQCCVSRNVWDSSFIRGMENTIQSNCCLNNQR